MACSRIRSGQARYIGGTTSTSPTNDGTVAIFCGELIWNEDVTELDMVWDDTIDNGDGTTGNIRARTAAEVTAQLGERAQEKASRNRREAWLALQNAEFDDVEDFHYYIVLYSDNDQDAKTRLKALGDSAAGIKVTEEAEMTQIAAWVAAGDDAALIAFIEA